MRDSGGEISTNLLCWDALKAAKAEVKGSVPVITLAPSAISATAPDGSGCVMMPTTTNAFTHILVIASVPLVVV